MNSKWPLTAAIAWTLLIIVLLTIPGRDLPNINVFEIDKLGHICIFFVWTWLWLTVFQNKSNHYIIVIASGIIFSGLSEIYQGILPFERSMDIFDVLADTIGIIFGSATNYILQMRRLKAINRPPTNISDLPR